MLIGNLEVNLVRAGELACQYMRARTTQISLHNWDAPWNHNSNLCSYQNAWLKAKSDNF